MNPSGPGIEPIAKILRYVEWRMAAQGCDCGSMGNGAALRLLSVLQNPGDQRGVHRFAGAEVRPRMIDQ